MRARIHAWIILTCILLFPVPREARGDETVPLEIVVNTQGKGEHLVTMTSAGDLLLTREQLKACGFRGIPEKAKITAQNLVSLASLSPEVGFEIRIQEAALVITVQPNLLEKTVINLGYKRPANVLSTRENSAFLNYAVAYSMGEGFDCNSLSIPAEIGARTGEYLLFSNFSYTKSDSGEKFARLMTNIIRDDTASSTRYVAGDNHAFSGILGGGGILGGLGIAKNFSLDPFAVRHQGLHVSGFLDTPSEVDLSVNGIPMKKANLPPGEFEFSGLSSPTGSGNTVLVIKDAFGREETVVASYYLSSRVLRAGLHDYRYNLGFKRADFGKESFRYEEAAFVGHHRYGFTETFTGGLAGEVDGDLLNLAGMATFVPWKTGEIDSAFALSRQDGKGGSGAFLGYSYSGRMLGGNVSCRLFSRDYANLSLDATDGHSHLEARVGFGLHSRSLGSLSAAVQFLSKYDAEDIRRMGIYYNRSLGNNVNLSISATTAVDLKTTYDVTAGLVFVLGRDHFGALNVHAQDYRESVTASVEKNQPRGPGTSYKFTAEAAKSDGRRVGGQASVEHKGPYGIYSAGLRSTPAGSIYDLNLSGGIAYMQRAFHASRPITDSFGLVTVGDVAGVKILYGNEEVAVTNSKGEAIVPGLLSHNDNKISIVPVDIPVNYEITRLDAYTSPPYRGGSLIAFDVRKIQAFEGRLSVVRKGRKQPAESAVIEVAMKDEVVEAVIGKRGEFYIENLRPGSWTARMTLGDEQCVFEMIVPESREMSVDLGELLCEPD